MRRALIPLVLILAACGGGGPGPSGPFAAPTAPAVWPLRGTTAADGEAIHRRPIVVKIANDQAARPQSGLAQADLVVEIPVEGGITRYAAVFHSQDPAKVGPVRSARQSDLNYLSTLRAILAHVGASESVTKMVRDQANSGAFVDIDEFQNAGVFERVAGKVAPYNAYTSGAKIREGAGAAGRARVDVPALQFAGSAGKATGIEAAALVIPYGGAGRVSYAFNAALGAYHRTQGGKTTTDEAIGKEVLPESVVVIKTEVKEILGTADVTGAPSVDFRATGTGSVVVLRDGKRFDGKWSRQGTEMYRFIDSAGEAIPLKPGLTWIHIVPEDYDLSSQG